MTRIITKSNEEFLVKPCTNLIFTSDGRIDYLTLAGRIETIWIRDIKRIEIYSYK